MFVKHNKKKKNFFKHQGFKISFLFSTVIFILLFVTFSCTSVILHFLIESGWLNLDHSLALSTLLLYMATLSISIGTALSSIAAHIFLKPIRELIVVANSLAKGNFSVRVAFSSFAKITELQDLTSSFNHMAEELEQTEILRRDFINNFSHEFKTPIISIRGFAKLLKKPSLSKEEQEEYLDIIIKESTRLSELTTNILNLTKLENQKILSNQTTFSLDEQIRRIVLLLQNKWESKQLDLEFDLTPLKFYGNEDLLSQVWLNLFDNAIKFSPMGEKIWISLSLEKELAVFRIRNRSSSLSSESLRHLFDKFYQGDSSHSTVGNGLGLALAKTIIELHCGKISVNLLSSDEIEFCCELPFLNP